MSTRREEQTTQVIKETIARAIETESNRTSLITVTNVTLSKDHKRATIHISVLPENQERAALDFLTRKKSFLRDALKKETRLRRIPFIDVQLDLGEKHRQRLDEISREIEE